VIPIPDPHPASDYRVSGFAAALKKNFRVKVMEENVTVTSLIPGTGRTPVEVVSATPINPQTSPPPADMLYCVLAG